MATEARFERAEGEKDRLHVKCAICGKYQLGRALYQDLLLLKDEEFAVEYAPRWVLSGAIRNQYQQGERPELLTSTVKTLLEVARPPEDPFDSIHLLLSHIQGAVASPAQAVQFNQASDYSLIYARGPEEFEYYLAKAQELELIELGPDGRGYRLGLEGWRRLKRVEERTEDRKQAFIAMWVEDGKTAFYTDGIEPALDERGYSPLRVNLKQHNDRIDDRTIADIRQSSLVVADFTGQRGSVYFEAGFAKGLGIPVVWTCRDDEVDDLHIDTGKYNPIIWETPEDLREQLVHRIAATLP